MKLPHLVPTSLPSLALPFCVPAVLIVAGALAAGCGGDDHGYAGGLGVPSCDDGDPSTPDLTPGDPPATGSDDPPSGATTTTGSGAPGGTTCRTDVPCGRDSDCAALPGTRCNQALEAPRCTTLQCATEGDLCSHLDFCAPGLECLDAASFGRETTDQATQAGTCVSLPSARAICKAACLETAPVPTDPFGGGGCSPGQLDAVCEHTCGLYPAGWPDSCLAETYSELNVFTFSSVSCDAFAGSCQVTLDCVNYESFPLDACGG